MLLPMRGYAYSSRDATPLAQRRLALQDVASMLDGLLRPAGS
jgi:hypothetical protein